MFVLLPAFAALLLLLFRRSRAFFVEHLVFSLHFHAFVFSVFAGQWLQGRIPWGPAHTAGGLLVSGLPVYLGLALERVYGGPTLGILLKGALLSALYRAVPAWCFPNASRRTPHAPAGGVRSIPPRIQPSVSLDEPRIQVPEISSRSASMSGRWNNCHGTPSDPEAQRHPGSTCTRWRPPRPACGEGRSPLPVAVCRARSGSSPLWRRTSSSIRRNSERLPRWNSSWTSRAQQESSHSP